jgi:hypothetical protein
VVSPLLRLASIACSIVLLLSFAAFVSDQAGHSSKKTVATIANEDETSPVSSAAGGAQPRHAVKHSPVRQKIDSADRYLTSPFRGVAANGSPWAEHIATTLFGLLVFGFGLGFLARLAALRGL